MMQAMLVWLESLPPLALYLALAAAAAAESVFPPLPTDAVAAFGGFLAARGNASVVAAFLATWGGSVAGAFGVYAAARWWRRSRLEHAARRPGADRLRALVQRRGVLGLALGRLLPAVRALVPPVAGVMGVSARQFIVPVAVVAAAWYGALTTVGYQAGENWRAVVDRIAPVSRAAAFVTLPLLAAVGGWWLWHRRRGAPHDPPPRAGDVP